MAKGIEVDDAEEEGIEAAEAAPKREGLNGLRLPFVETALKELIDEDEEEDDDKEEVTAGAVAALQNKQGVFLKMERK